MVAVMTPLDEILVALLALKVVVFFVFHVIVSFRVMGLPAAKVEMLIAAVLSEPLLVPPVTAALAGFHRQNDADRLRRRRGGQAGEIVIVPLGFAQVVPPGPRRQARRPGKRPARPTRRPS